MARSSRPSKVSLYFDIVERWEKILARSMPDDIKQAECLALLNEHIDKLARARMRQANPPLRFYSDMKQLHELLRPRGDGNGDLVRLAVEPAYRLVGKWLDEHR